MYETAFANLVLPRYQPEARARAIATDGEKNHDSVPLEAKKYFVRLLHQEFKLQRMVNQYVPHAEDLYDVIAEDYGTVNRAAIEDHVGFPAEEAFNRIDVLRDSNIPIAHFESSLLAIGDPDEVFQGEEKLEDFKGKYDVPKPDVKAAPKRPDAKKQVTKDTKKLATGTKAGAKKDPGKTKTVSKDGAAAPARPAAKNVVQPKGGTTTAKGKPEVKKTIPPRQDKVTSAAGKASGVKPTATQVSQKQVAQKKTVKAEADERNKKTPFRGNIANDKAKKETKPLSKDQAAKKATTAKKIDPKAKDKAGIKKDVKKPAATTTKAVKQPKKEVVDDYKFAPPNDYIKKVKAHVDSPKFRDKIKKMFDKFDVNKNGLLDQEECKPLAKEIKKEMQNEGFEMLDHREGEI